LLEQMGLPAGALRDCRKLDGDWFMVVQGTHA
jgi:hypothetical protein